MGNNTRTNLAAGRLEAAYDIIDNVAKEYNDQFSEEDKDKLASALKDVGYVSGSLAIKSSEE